MTRPMRSVLFGLLLVCATLAYGTQAPKYIFLFIGDGMGFNHVEASQIYAEKVGTDTGERSLLFPTFSRDDTSVHTVGLSLDNLLFGSCHSFGDGRKDD